MLSQGWCSGSDPDVRDLLEPHRDAVGCLRREKDEPLPVDLAFMERNRMIDRRQSLLQPELKWLLLHYLQSRLQFCPYHGAIVGDAPKEVAGTAIGKPSRVCKRTRVAAN